MEERFQLGQAGGRLLMREEGGRVAFEAERPEDGRGLYKAYLTGAGEKFLLGTFMPEGGMLRLRRTLTVNELSRRGLWPVTGGAAELAFAFGQGGGQPQAQPSRQHAPQGWRLESAPGRLLGDRLLVQSAAGLTGALVRRREGGFDLALAYEFNRPFPLTPLFCFAHLEEINGRVYAVFRFNQKGCPRQERD